MNPHHAAPNPAVGHLPPGEHEHESSDISIRGIAIFFAILVVTAAVLHILLWGLFSYYARHERRPAKPPESAAIGSAPRLQNNPAEDLARMREAEARALDAYGWVDREAGVVRIPIDRAMRLIAGRGLPARGDTPKDSRAAWRESATERIKADRARQGRAAAEADDMAERREPAETRDEDRRAHTPQESAESRGRGEAGGGRDEDKH